MRRYLIQVSHTGIVRSHLDIQRDLQEVHDVLIAFVFIEVLIKVVDRGLEGRLREDLSSIGWVCISLVAALLAVRIGSDV